MTQNARLISYLTQHGSITQLEAFNALGICRLSERVRELEALGWIIRHDHVQVPSRHLATGHTYVTRYTLLAEPNAARQVPVSVSLGAGPNPAIVPAAAAPDKPPHPGWSYL